MAAYSIANLAAELKNDPLSLGYAALVTAGNCVGLASLLNALTGAGTGNVAREPQPGYLLLTQINATELLALTATQLACAQFVMSSDLINLSDANTQAILLLIFTSSPTTKAALTAAVHRTGSRAEVLWGTGTTITTDQIAAAIATGNA